MMSLLSGCITVASAAISNAGVDCVDLVTGGVAAIVGPSVEIPESKSKAASTTFEDLTRVVQDIHPAEHETILAVCVVGYLQSRDEITEIWIRGDAASPHRDTSQGQTKLDILIGQAIKAAVAARHVLIEAISEPTRLQTQR